MRCSKDVRGDGKGETFYLALRLILTLSKRGGFCSRLGGTLNMGGGAREINLLMRNKDK